MVRVRSHDPVAHPCRRHRAVPKAVTETVIENLHRKTQPAVVEGIAEKDNRDRLRATNVAPFLRVSLAQLRVHRKRGNMIEDDLLHRNAMASTGVTIRAIGIVRTVKRNAIANESVLGTVSESVNATVNVIGKRIVKGIASVIENATGNGNEIGNAVAMIGIVVQCGTVGEISAEAEEEVGANLVTVTVGMVADTIERMISLLGAGPASTTAGIPPLMSIPTKPPIGSLIPPAVAAKLNLSNDPSKLGQLGLPAVQDPSSAAVSGMLLSRSALLRNTAKAAQLEKMGIDVLQQNQKAVDSVPLPSYYNPGVVNPVRYADQVQKRKLLWSHKTNESKEVSSNISKWEQAKFAQDTDGRVASKFLRLMGVKDALPKAGEDPVPAASASSSSTTPTARGSAAVGGGAGSGGASNGGGKSTGDSIKKQEELFSTMEQQYEVARQVTHTMRGVGLGFSSQARQF
uniref:Small acidic protein-like domain-containing protein n=1 Tax=Anopheles farauti TaxID=69004 RepID=A0A182QFD4_9DIPT